MDLTGTWQFYANVAEATLEQAPSTIQVPGAWQTQGYGPPGGTMPAALLDTETSPADHLRHNLTARCLYMRDLDVPASWRGERIFLCVRRVYARADLTVNGKWLGEYDGFSSPFEFDVTDAIECGATNRLVLGVDNRPRPGSKTFGTANWFANWGGFGGGVYLEARPAVRIEDVFAMPKVAESMVVLRISLTNQGRGFTSGLKLLAAVQPAAGDHGSVAVRAEAAPSGSGQLDLAMRIPDAQLWTPDTPCLYSARVQLLDGTRVLDTQSIRFGLREITARGDNLFLNGKPLYLSGYGDDATEPITGMLPNDKEVYRRRLTLMRQLGFNFVRHHSAIPHDEYFEAADEVGMLVQPEAGMAYTKFWPSAHQLFEREWPRIVRAYRNHPSIWAWCMGNELYLSELPERDTNSLALALSKPVVSGPLTAAAVTDNGVFGPPGQFPTRTFKRSNYYRDVAALVDGQAHRLMGAASTRRVFTDGPHELGLKFTSSRDGLMSHVRYYRVPEETGAHIGRLWDATGRELARVPFTNETASGWQEAPLPEPVPLRAHTLYVVSVNANSAYAATPGDSAAFGREDALALVAQAYRQAKELDPTRLVHASDGGQLHPHTDVFSSGGAEKFEPKPFLLHEYGTYTCSLPDFSLIPRLNGIIRPLTYERAEQYVREHQLLDIYPRLYRSSLLMRADAQKHYIEAAKATSRNNGFSFWLGIDFPDSPEGCWDEGILNQLWEPKPYLTNGLPDILGPTVLLCSAGLDARTLYSGAGKKVTLRLWHYGQRPIADGQLDWRVTGKNDRLLGGESRTGFACEPGQTVSLLELQLPPIEASAPESLKLQALLRQGNRLLTTNSWEFHVYPRPESTDHRGVYSEIPALPGATYLDSDEALPADLRVLVTRGLKRERHQQLLERGHAAVLLLGNAGFKETRAGYFLNQYGAAFGGIIEDHPVFAAIPHDGRLQPALYQLIAGGGLLETDRMPAPLRDGAVVWGLKLTAWISPVKDLNKALHWAEVLTEEELHFVLCSFDLLTDKPESRYVLAKTLEYLSNGKPSDRARRCRSLDLHSLLK
jgi:hypothetical protein